MRVCLVLASTTAAIISGVFAQGEDLLFHSYFKGWEDNIAKGEYTSEASPYNWTYYVASPKEWADMTADDFKKYKAIIIGDPIRTEPDYLEPLMENRNVWGPAVDGNVILIGTDTANHYRYAEELMTNGIAFAASGEGLGLYFSLSKYYGDRGKSTVEILDIFGTFEVRGDLNEEEDEQCYDDVHIVAKNEVLDGITDTVLSNWSCSVHEAFVSYPSTGDESFVPLAIAQGVPGEGSKDFSDGTSGIPYILVRGASPIGCGNGKLDPGEECDDGNTKNGDGCNYACRKEARSKPTAGVIAGGVVGAVAGVAALGAMSYLALTKTALGGKVAGAMGITTAASGGGGSGGAAAAAGGAAYTPTGAEGKAAAAIASYIPTGVEAKAAAAAQVPWAPGTEQVANSVAQGTSAITPADPSSLMSGTQAATAVPPVDPGSAAATQAISSGVPPPDPSAAITGGSAAAAPPPPMGYVPGSEAVATQAAGAGSGAAGMTPGVSSGAGAYGAATMTPAASGGGAYGAATMAPAAGTGGGMTAQQTAAAIAAGFAGLGATLFGRKKKKNKQEQNFTDPMPVPPMAPSQTEPHQHGIYQPHSVSPPPVQPFPNNGIQYQYQYQSYQPGGHWHQAPIPQQQQQQQMMYYQPQPQPLPHPQALYATNADTYEEKEIKTGEASSESANLNIGVREVVPTPGDEYVVSPVEMEQPEIPQPPQAPSQWYQQPGQYR